MTGMKKALAAASLVVAAWAAVLTVRRHAKAQAAPEDLTMTQAAAERSEKSERLRRIEAELAGWPQGSRRAAQRMMLKYGPPDEATPRALTWNDNGPWKRTIVHRDAGRDVLEQIAGYHVPNDRYDVIGHLPGNVSAERGRDELSARAPDEPLNFLYLNLADEVISGRRDAESAVALYRQTQALTASGKTSPYTESLLFAPPQPGAQP